MREPTVCLPLDCDLGGRPPFVVAPPFAIILTYRPKSVKGLGELRILNLESALDIAQPFAFTICEHNTPPVGNVAASTRSVHQRAVSLREAPHPQQCRTSS
jgi:hypothetical protein